MLPIYFYLITRFIFYRGNDPLKKILIIISLIVFIALQNISLACTGFTASDGNLVLFGNNEDWYDPDPYIRIYPAESGIYGRLFIEFQWPPENPRYYVPFTGINDQGLCFDSFLHPFLIPTESQNKPYFNGDLIAYCLEVCSTVDEVIEIFDMYNLAFMDDFQYFIVDRDGNSAIIEGDEIIYKQGDFQVVTNFLQSNPDHGWYPCWRYNTAVSMLESMTELSVDYFTQICDATHQEGAYPTVYSYVNDLNNNIMYLYHYYNYDKVVVLDVNQEISQGGHSYYLPDLFQEGENHPPLTPSRPNGPSTGKTNREYTYSTSTTDPDDDKIMYMFDWGDGTESRWLGPVDSGEIIQADHEWDTKGIYEIKVKARDINGELSEWSETFSVSMPKYKVSFNFLKQIIFDILNQIIHEKLVR